MQTYTDKQITTKAGRKYLLHIFHGRNYSPPAATVWEVCNPYNEHNTITTFDCAPGCWLGRLGSRRLPKWIDAIPAKGKDLDRRLHLCAIFRNRQKRIAHAIRQALEDIHATPIRAEYDAAGNCIYCGEAGRCPGYHAVKSIGGF